MHIVDNNHRHCDSCVKDVVDFTQMSDDELLLYFKNSKDKICGRFLPQQLNRAYTPIPETTHKSPWWKAAVLVPLAFLAKNSQAQQNDSVFVPDSLEIIKNDSLARPVAEMNDSVVVIGDSTEAVNDSVELTVEKEPSLEIEFVSTEAIITGSMVLGACPIPAPEAIVGGIGPMEPELPPRVSPYWYQPWFDLWKYFRKADRSATIEQGGDPSLAVTELNKPLEKPVPPPIPAAPWYEAVLPSILRIRRNK